MHNVPFTVFVRGVHEPRVVFNLLNRAMAFPTFGLLVPTSYDQGQGRVRCDFVVTARTTEAVERAAREALLRVYPEPAVRVRVGEPAPANPQ